MGAEGATEGVRRWPVFVGTFEHTLDDKGRLVLPTSFRSRLADGAFLSQYENCLALWSAEEFSGFVGRLMEKLRSKEVAPSAVRVLTANAAEVKPDSAGRVTIPPRRRAYGGLSTEIVLTGALDHIELWAPPRWQSVSAEGDEGLAHAVATLGIF